MPPDAVNAMGIQQEAYFREYDRVDVDRHPETGRECADDGEAKTSKQKTTEVVHSCLTAYVRRQPSHTVVIESAIYLLRQGVCHIKGKQIMNAKWALAFLHFAVWVQLKKSMQWIETDVLQDTDSVHATSCHELQALFGFNRFVVTSCRGFMGFCRSRGAILHLQFVAAFFLRGGASCSVAGFCG